MDISVPIVGYIFVCIAYPRLVKNKPQFYMAFAVLLIILVLDVMVGMAGGPVAAAVGGMSKFLVVLRGVLFIVDFILLVLATGGLSLHELGGELKGAYEVMRRGEDTKTVIIPLTGQQPKSKEEVAAERAARAAAAAAAPMPKEEGERSIPLD